MLITNKGMLIRTRVYEVSVIGRNTQGVRLITLERAEEKVSGIAKLPEASEDDEAAAETTSPPDPLSMNGEGEKSGETP